MLSTFLKSVQGQGPMEDELFRQVQEHKYYINQLISNEVPWEEAFESWTQVVYGPLSSAIDEEGLDREFPEISEDQLFVNVSRHWHYMKDNGTVVVSPREAALDYGATFAKTEDSRASFRLKKQFL